MKRAWVLGMAVLGCAFAGADEIAEKGRAVVAQHAEAVVTVRVVTHLKVSMGGMPGFDQELEEEVTGLVIQPDGLTVLSLANTDPSSMLEDMFGGMAGGMMDQMDISTDIKALTLVLADGKEHDAQIVLRDSDLDLAFLRPVEKPGTPWPHLDLAQNAPLKQLDPYMVIYRLGKEAKRTAGAAVQRLAALMEKPRLFYLLGVDFQEGYLGAPAFTLEGKVVGLVTIRSISMSGMGSEPDIVLVILPAADVAEAAAQAPEKAPEAEKPAAGDGEEAPAAEAEDAGEPAAEEAPVE